MLYNLQKGKEALGLHKQEPLSLSRNWKRMGGEPGETGGLLNLDLRLLIRR